MIPFVNIYHIDLEQTWTDFLEQGRARLSDEAVVTALCDTIRQNLERRQQG